MISQILHKLFCIRKDGYCILKRDRVFIKHLIFPIKLYERPASSTEVTLLIIILEEEKMIKCFNCPLEGLKLFPSNKEHLVFAHLVHLALCDSVRL